MYPILIDNIDITIRTYHVLMLFGIIAGFITLHLTLRKNDKLDYKKTILFAALIFIPFVIGSRLGYFFECLITKNPYCVNGRWYDIIGPVSLWWGLVIAVLCAFPFARLLKTDVWETADVFSPSIAIGGFFIRLGCFFNGCCLGACSPPDFPFAVMFPVVPYDPSAEVYRYPVQIYSSFAWLVTFVVLIIRSKRKFFKGELILDMAVLFSVSRFIIEFYRYHSDKTIVSIAQVFSIIIIIISGFLFYYFMRKTIKSRHTH